MKFLLPLIMAALTVTQVIASSETAIPRGPFFYGGGHVLYDYQEDLRLSFPVSFIQGILGTTNKISLNNEEEKDDYFRYQFNGEISVVPQQNSITGKLKLANGNYFDNLGGSRMTVNHDLDVEVKSSCTGGRGLHKVKPAVGKFTFRDDSYMERVFDVTGEEEQSFDFSTDQTHYLVIFNTVHKGQGGLDIDAGLTVVRIYRGPLYEPLHNHVATVFGVLRTSAVCK